ncbi:hypothetical protein SSS_05567 [Sarcoptes scabiei]|uniref:Uncharacterized protein n=1 Tax=Sarcoptes scabiei TaxID=52283 RepID=A0A834VD60_SARSC|nr:hypothetical protein SSS_05567 [Sarcoptes scabiei]
MSNQSEYSLFRDQIDRDHINSDQVQVDSLSERILSDREEKVRKIHEEKFPKSSDNFDDKNPQINNIDDNREQFIDGGDYETLYERSKSSVSETERDRSIEDSIKPIEKFTSARMGRKNLIPIKLISTRSASNYGDCSSPSSITVATIINENRSTKADSNLLINDSIHENHFEQSTNQTYFDNVSNENIFIDYNHNDNENVEDENLQDKLSSKPTTISFYKSSVHFGSTHDGVVKTIEEFEFDMSPILSVDGDDDDDDDDRDDFRENLQQKIFDHSAKIDHDRSEANTEEEQSVGVSQSYSSLEDYLLDSSHLNLYHLNRYETLN